MKGYIFFDIFLFLFGFFYGNIFPSFFSTLIGSSTSLLLLFFFELINLILYKFKNIFSEAQFTFFFSILSTRPSIAGKQSSNPKATQSNDFVSWRSQTNATEKLKRKLKTIGSSGYTQVNNGSKQINSLKIGFIFGLFVDAFKVGS